MVRQHHVTPEHAMTVIFRKLSKQHSLLSLHLFHLHSYHQNEQRQRPQDCPPRPRPRPPGLRRRCDPPYRRWLCRCRGQHPSGTFALSSALTPDPHQGGF